MQMIQDWHIAAVGAVMAYYFMKWFYEAITIFYSYNYAVVSGNTVYC
jgi:hypothetical protein